jgi:uncharacterized protein (DUF2384 family)
MRNAEHQAVDPQNSPSPAESGLGVFFSIADEWSLTGDQQITLLGSPARSTFFKWKKDGGALSIDAQERVSHIVSIYKALTILFSDPDRAKQWLRRANSYFDSKSALDVMLGGKVSDIYKVRTYVDAQRGG